MAPDCPRVYPLPAGARAGLLAVRLAGVALDAPDRPDRYALALAPCHQPRRVLYLDLGPEDALALLECLEDALTRPRTSGREVG